MADDEDKTTLDLSELIADVGHGAANRTGTKLLTEVMQACRETGKKGKVSLTITVGAVDDLCDLKIEFKVTKPMNGVPSGSYYVTKESGISVEDPKQLTLPVPRAVPPARVIRMDPKNGGDNNGGNVS